MGQVVKELDGAKHETREGLGYDFCCLGIVSAIWRNSEC
jgi:hypothetical protein